LIRVADEQVGLGGLATPYARGLWSRIAAPISLVK
jgi:hypothetical protein